MAHKALQDFLALTVFPALKVHKGLQAPSVQPAFRVSRAFPALKVHKDLLAPSVHRARKACKACKAPPDQLVEVSLPTASFFIPLIS